MPDYYIFVRCWVGFNPDSDFPFDQFNSLPDDQAASAVEAYFVDMLSRNRAQHDQRVHRKSAELQLALKRRQKQMTARPGLHSVTAERERLRDPNDIQHDETRGHWYARIAGICHMPHHSFGGLSPSRQLFVLKVDSLETAKTLIAVLGRRVQLSEMSSDLTLRFGCVPAGDMSDARRVGVELSMDGPPPGTRDDQEEAIRRAVLPEAIRALKKIEVTQSRPETAIKPAQTDSKATLSDADRKLLESIPALDKKSSKWITQVGAARLLIGEHGTNEERDTKAKKKVAALNKARKRGVHDKLLEKGVDNDRYMWRVDPEGHRTTFWYLKRTLSKK